MNTILSYIVATIVCHVCYLIVWAPFGILAPLARKGPHLANYVGTLIAFCAAMLSVLLLSLIPMTFPKASVILPALIRFISDFTRWSRAKDALQQAGISSNDNIDGLKRVIQLEAGSIWGSCLGYLLAADTILKNSPLY
jgi:hypothetical protein